MERAALPGRLTWHLATVVGTVEETPRARTLVLDVPGWSGHRAGQHVDVRLTAEDGYRAQRAYSIASAPDDPHLALTVERLDDGEVSPYLVDELRVGDELELRGPIGGYFVWDGSSDAPVLLVAGGSGVVPFRAMLRHHVAAGDGAPVRLLHSARSLDEVIYRDELAELAEESSVDVRITLTRTWPSSWDGLRGRIDAATLAEAAWPASDNPLTFVCGPTGLVEAVAAALVGQGHDPARIKTERFGPTGS
ncbi:MAG TPA: ferredoxin reductase [Actinotalea sp.]